MTGFWKKTLLVLKIVGGLVVVGLVGFAIFVSMTWDRVYDAPLPEVTISSDPKVIAHGEYLVFGPAHCAMCHTSSADALSRIAAGEKVPLSGGTKFVLGPLGSIYSKNLTPDPETGIGKDTDSHIARMMRWSVRPNGRASIDPFMPFGNMSEDDLIAIISYLRAQKPVRNPVPANEWTTFGKVIRSVSSTFKPRKTINPPKVAPAEAPTVERGEYLARYVSNCVGCHTPRDPMNYAAIGPDFSGGFEMEPIPLPGADPQIWFKTPNITPAPEGALMKFPDRATFIARFRVGGRHYDGSPMPWELFSGMSETDLSAVYEFLHTLPPSPGPTGDPDFRKSH